MRWSLIFALLLLLAGCGTLAGSEQPIGFDSEPRGLGLKFSDSKESYATPAIVFRPRAFKQRFALHTGQSEKQYATRCGLRWAESIIPNLVVTGFGLVNPAFYALGGIFLGVDTYNGTAFQCPDVIRVAVGQPDATKADETVDVQEKTDGEKVEEPSYCRKYILASLKHPDSKAAEQAAEIWIEKTREYFRDTCNKVVSYEDGRAAFQRFGLDHTTGASPQLHQRSLYFDIGARVGATHIAFPTYDKSVSPATIGTRVWDIAGKKWDPTQKIPPVAIVDQELNRSLREPSWFARSINYLPNALLYNLAGQKMAALPEKPASYKLTSDKEVFNVPRVLTSFGIGLADNPRSHAPWDLAFQVYPSLFTHYTKREMSFEYDSPGPRGNAPKTIDYRVEYLYALPLINVGPTFHTPAGAFSFHLSGGLVTLFLNDSLNNKRSRATLGIGYKVSYTAFVTERVFVRIEAEAYKQQTRLLTTQYIKELDAIAATFVSVGYHIPDGKGWVRNLF